MTSASDCRFDLNVDLKSDLCVAVGDGYSSSIDVDVCHVDMGVPIIPSRRLKGCLRDAACLLGYEGTPAFDSLFGVRGASQGGSLRISDAEVVGAAELVCGSLSERDARDPWKVLSAFTYTRAQTAIGNDGSAQENTLRFIRVVKQYAPPSVSASGELGQSPLRFVSHVSCADDDAQVSLLEDCCKALRNIGYGRNRGLGAVRCSLVQRDEEQAGHEAISLSGRSGFARVAYTVRLDSALMLPQQNGSESLDFIPGASVLGFFANRLGGSRDFDDLFLNGKVGFSPLYPAFDGARCRPAPPFAVKVKGGLRDGHICTSWQVRGDEVAKPLKGGYVGAGLQLRQPVTEIVYHHGVNAPDVDASLYTQRCLRQGQLFAGFIEGDAALVAKLAAVLEESACGLVSFGRSKTAQYSRCSLAGLEEGRLLSPLDVHLGKRYAFVFDSDAVFVRDGMYSTQIEDILDAIKDGLGAYVGIFREADIDTDAERFGTSLRLRTVTGYNAKWNQKKPHVSAIAAGSSISFVAASSAMGVPAEFVVGSRAAEGFGRVLLVSFDEDGNAHGEFDPAPTWSVEEPGEGASLARGGKSIEELRCATIDFAETQKWKFGSDSLGRAFIGRLSRMVKEAGDAGALDERLGSIKSEAKRKTSMDLVNSCRRTLGPGLPWDQERECLALLFALGKYYAKQAEGAGSNREGASDEQ